MDDSADFLKKWKAIPKRRTAVRFSVEGFANLLSLSAHYHATQAAVIELLVSREALRLKL